MSSLFDRYGELSVLPLPGGGVVAPGQDVRVRPTERVTGFAGRVMQIRQYRGDDRVEVEVVQNGTGAVRSVRPERLRPVRKRKKR